MKRIGPLLLTPHRSELGFEALLDRSGKLLEGEIDERLDELGEKADLALVGLRDGLAGAELGSHGLDCVDDVEDFLPEGL